MLAKVRNVGNKVFLYGRWVENGQEALVPKDKVEQIILTNPKIVKIEEQNKKKQR